MKKTLFGTTALIAASVAMAGTANAQGIELSVGGYMNNYFGIGDVEVGGVDQNETGHFSDGEIAFTGETTLDNGITVGANVQLESFSSGDQIDENYAYVEGSFGRVLLGSENTAAYLMQYGAPNVGVPINSGWITPFIATPGTYGNVFRHPGGSTFGDWGNDENRVTYFTPRFAGFQVGASYTPTLTGTGEGANFPTNAPFPAEGNHGAAVGVNFVRSFNGFDVAVAGGWRSILNENGAVYGDSPTMWSAGVNLGYAGFTVGGSWLMEDNENPAGQEFGSDGNAFDVGASYSTGPWSVGITYLTSDTEGAPGAGDRQLDSVSGGVEYALGPGITTAVSVLWADMEDSAGTESEGILGIAGMTLSF